MAKHKPVCFVIMLLVIVGALNWGLVGLGMLLGGNSLNVVNMLLGSWPTVEALVYVVVGLAGIGLLIAACSCKHCSCEGGKCMCK